MQILDQYIQELSLSFNLKNIPVFIKYSFKNMYNIENIKKRYIEIINNCKTIEDVDYLKKDLNNAIKQLTQFIIPSFKLLNKDKSELTSEDKLALHYVKMYNKYGSTEKDIKKYVEWLKTDAKKLLNDKTKEIRNK